jgi:16S rRNA (cytosine1402-N4)-methyltransferase
MVRLKARREEPIVEQREGHRPVLLGPSIRLLDPRPGAVVVDLTLGAGGHAEALLEIVGPSGRLIGIDRDPAALELATRRLARFGSAFVPVHGRHEDLLQIVRSLGHGTVDTLLADLGVSSLQLDDPARGFSFQGDGPLDMRMDPTSGRTAAELVAGIEERDLVRLLWSSGEEPQARAIARAIVRERAREPILTTRRLASIVERAAGPAARARRIHPATRTVQALRIAVNGELERLGQAVQDAAGLLAAGGRLAVIAFHSLEDRIVKHTLRALSRHCVCPPGLPVCACGEPGLVRVLTPRPLRPDAAEIGDNPRARSARLRAAERL